MQVSFDDSHDVFTCDEEAPGFSWNPLLDRYETARLKYAAALRANHDEGCKKLFDAITCRVLEPWSGGIPIPKGLKLDKGQRLGVLHALERNHSYIAFEQGVGKTPTAICAMAAFGQKTIVLCPPHLIQMWQREIERWSKFKLRVATVRDFTHEDDVVLCPDSIIGDVRYQRALLGFGARLLIVEEAQRFVNQTAHRTQALFGDLHKYRPTGFVHQFEKVMFLSGTPMPNRPIELFPVLRACAANLIDYKDKTEFGLRYCGAFEGEFGWDFRGSTNEEELRKKIFSLFMRREEKGEDYAKKTQEVYLINAGSTKKLKELEQAVLQGRKLSEFIKAVKTGNVDLDRNHQLGTIADYRSAVGLRKVAHAANWIENILENSTESVLALGWHQGAVVRLAERLGTHYPVVINGKTPYSLRESRIASFQKGNTRLLIANLMTLVGYNIDKATRVVFFEYSWVPADNDQAMDRAHRRTSTRPVLVEFLVLQDSLDEYVLGALLKKKKTIDKVISKPKLLKGVTDASDNNDD